MRVDKCQRPMIQWFYKQERERESTMFDETDTIEISTLAFEAEWDEFMADLFDEEPESNGWEW